MPDAGDLRLVTLTGHSREHADVLTYVAPSHVVILCRLLSRGDRGKLFEGRGWRTGIRGLEERGGEERRIREIGEG